MEKEQILSLIGVAVFLIVTSLTYGIVTPTSQTTNTSLVTVTNEITNIAANNTTNPVDNDSQLTKDYRIVIAITAGVVIAIVAVFLLGYW
jgi:hypothetical protein